MTAVIVCKGCLEAYRIPRGEWPACLNCQGDEYRLEHREGDDLVRSLDVLPIALHDIGDGPDREPWEDREDRQRLNLHDKLSSSAPTQLLDLSLGVRTERSDAPLASASGAELLTLKGKR